MHKLLIDTCVWLDLAKDNRQQPLISVLEQLVSSGDLDLLKLELIVDEFGRNKQRLIDDNRRSLSSALKRAKDAVDRLGDHQAKEIVIEQLNEVDHKLPSHSESISDAVGKIENLLQNATTIEASDAIKLRAAQRALDKNAPCHRQRNSIADAIIIEAYRTCMDASNAAECNFAFVSHNVKDFSMEEGDTRQPHSDLADLFRMDRSRYFTSLGSAVKWVNPDLVSEMELEKEEWLEEPRSRREIISAINEFCDKVWYNRHKYREQQIEFGEIELVEKEEFPVKDHTRRPIQRDIWQGALAAAAKTEARYGRESLGPYSDFEWGMLSGKLSALRWVMGDEWDMLDT